MLQLQLGNRLFEFLCLYLPYKHTGTHNISKAVLENENYSYPMRSLFTLFIHWFALMYTMTFLPLRSLINSDTFSQEKMSPKQIIVQNILCNKGFPIHLMTEQHEKIIH